MLNISESIEPFNALFRQQTNRKHCFKNENDYLHFLKFLYFVHCTCYFKLFFQILTVTQKITASASLPLPATPTHPTRTLPAIKYSIPPHSSRQQGMKGSADDRSPSAVICSTFKSSIGMWWRNKTFLSRKTVAVLIFPRFVFKRVLDRAWMTLACKIMSIRPTAVPNWLVPRRCTWKSNRGCWMGRRKIPRSWLGVRRLTWRCVKSSMMTFLYGDALQGIFMLGGGGVLTRFSRGSRMFKLIRIIMFLFRTNRHQKGQNKWKKVPFSIFYFIYNWKLSWYTGCFTSDNNKPDAIENATNNTSSKLTWLFFMDLQNTTYLIRLLKSNCVERLSKNTDSKFV